MKNEAIELVLNQTPQDRITIEEANFSVRTYNCLKRSGYAYIDELLDLTEADLHRIRNMGYKSVKEVIVYLSTNKVSKPKEKNDARTAFLDNSFMKYLLYVSIDDLNLGVRSKNVIKMNSIKTVYELINFDFFNAKNAGAKTVDEISSAIKLLKNDFLAFVNNVDKIPEKYVKLKMIDISDCKNIHCSNSEMSVEEGYSEYLEKIDDILKFETETDYQTFKFFKDIFSNNSILLSDKIDELFNKLKISQDDVDIYIRRGKGDTLELLGTRYGVTRERIRQKDVNIVRKIKHIYNQLKLKSLLKEYIIYVNNLPTSLPEKYNYLFCCRLDELDEAYIRVDFNNQSMMIEKNYYDECLTFIDGIYGQIDSNNYVETSIIKNSGYDSNLLDYFLDVKQIVVFDSYAIFKTTKRGKTAIYLENKKMIDISTKEKLESVISDINSTFDMEIDSERILRSYLEDCAYSLGNGKFVPYSVHPLIPDDILNQIFECIEEQKTVNCKILYLKYKEKIENMLSPTHLYLYLKKEYPNRFNYGGNNITISKLGYEASYAGIVYEYIKSCVGPVDGSDIMLKNNIDNTALSVIVSQNKDIFRLNSNNDFYLVSKLVRVQELRDYIDDYICSLSKDRIYLRDIYIWLYNKDANILSDNYIYSMEELLIIINLICVNSLKNYSYDRASKQFIRKKVVMDMFGDEI